MKTKFVVEIAITFEHDESDKILKRDVRNFLIHELSYNGDLEKTVDKIVIRSVDKD